MWGLERKPSRFARDLDLGDVHDQLDALRGFVQELSQSVGHEASSSYGRARALAAEAARDAEETMKDNLAAAGGWWREMGQGRFVYLSPGHTPEALNHPMMQRLIRNSARWLLRKRGE